MRIFRMVEHPEESNQNNSNRKIMGSCQHDPNAKECVGKVKKMKTDLKF